MKTLLFLFSLTMSTGFAFSQISYFYQYTNDSIGTNIPQCVNAINFYFYISLPNSGDNITITVNWGDGTSDNSTFDIPTPTGVGFTSGGLSFTHSYSVPGAYVGSYTVYSEYMAGNYLSDVPVEFVSASSTSCGYLTNVGVYSSNFTTDYNMLNSGVPLDFTGVDGITTTIYPIIGSTYHYTGLNPDNAPYAVLINPDWLIANNLMQTTQGLEIISFDQFGEAFTQGFASWGSINAIYVDCNGTAANNDVAVSHGNAFDFVAPLETGYLSLAFCNYACDNSTDAQVTVDMPSDFIPNTSGLTNATVSGTTLTFDLIDIENCEYVSIPFIFPGITPAGTQICFPITITAPGDTDLSNNSYSACGIVLNSYDPNDKQVNQPAAINPDTQETFLYQIRFQNDGNFPAVNVVVRDTMSSNLDLSTFRLLNSSHPVAYQVNPTTREVTFTFNAIWLESSDVDLEASQGFIRYEIKEETGLIEGDAIENTAYIYFDFNPPIITNTTVNTNAYPLSLNQNMSSSLTMYPNPSSGTLNFSGDQVQKVVMYDVLGQMVLSKLITNNSLSVSNLNTGVYFVEIHTPGDQQTKKLILK